METQLFYMKIKRLSKQFMQVGTREHPTLLLKKHKKNVKKFGKRIIELLSE